VVLVEIRVADPNRPRLDAEGAKAELLVERARANVGFSDGQHELLEARLGLRHVDRMLQELRADSVPGVIRWDIHPEYRRLVPVLRPRLTREPHDAGKLAALERSEDPVETFRREAPLRRVVAFWT